MCATEHHRRGADFQRERENSDQSEAAILVQSAQGVAEVAKKILDAIREAPFATVLLDLF